MSDPRGYDAFAAALEQARVARDRGAGAVTAFAEVSRGGVLSALTDDARALARAELAPLYDHDAAARARTSSRRCRSGSTTTARTRHPLTSLGVHRHTVRTRLALVERVLGRDLSSFATRAELWAALRALDA